MPAETTPAPTSIPDGAVYYDGFEEGTFPDDPEWSTDGDALWEITTERANSGVFSIKSPDLMTPEDMTTKTADASLITNPAWEGGTLHYSVLAGVEMPFDDLIVTVDGEQVNQWMAESTDFVAEEIVLGPGPHTITFSYRHNPAGVGIFPPIPPDRIGAAFIDDVYFVPGDGAPLPPAPTSVPGEDTTIAPTSIPDGALYYDGFEQGTFPEFDPEWTTEGDGLWELTSERASSGVYSIRSPDLMDPDDVTPKTSNATLITNPQWPAGALVFSILAGVEMPFDVSLGLLFTCIHFNDAH